MHAYMYLIVMTKVISISEEAYNQLSELKEDNDSFSKVVLRIAKKVKKVSLLEFAGKWKGNKSEVDRIFKEIAQERKNVKLREEGI